MRLCVGALGCLLVLSGCSQTNAPDPDVASVDALGDAAAPEDITDATWVSDHLQETSDGVGGDLDITRAKDSEPAPMPDVDSADVPPEVELGPQPSIQIPVTPPIGAPFPVLVNTPGAEDLTLDLLVDDDPASVRLYRGRGSLSAIATEATSWAVTTAGPWESEASALPESRPERTFSGPLSADDLVWDAAADIILDGVVTVPEGETLVLGPDTRVLAGTKARLEVAGAIVSDGPVLFTRAGSAAWGSLVVTEGGSASLTDTWFLGGGGDASRSFGHSSSQPVVKAVSATMTMNGGGILDSPGKGLGGHHATMTVNDILISRCDTGGELVLSSLSLSRAHILEIPDGDGVLEDDDNDGLYFEGALKVDGAPVTSVLTDVVFAVGEDDGVDHHNGSVRIVRGWFMDLAHEGVAASGVGSVDLEDSVVMGCDQGIEAGYGTPAVTVRHCLLTGNRVGLRFGDHYDWADEGTLDVTHSISVGNSEANVLNLTDTGSPAPGAVAIACSMVDDNAFDDAQGNLPGVPSWNSDGCSDTLSPCDDQPMGPRICE